MNRGEQNAGAGLLRAGIVLIAASSLLFSVACGKLAARDQLNKGVAAYRNARYEEAIEHFKKAVNQDPTLVNAKLYLATAYAGQYIPQVDTPENLRNAQEAINTYQQVIDSNPPRDSKVLALKGIASIYYNMKKLDDSKQYDQKVLEIDPNDPETYYSIGVIDWAQSYANTMKERAAVGAKATDMLKDKKACAKLKQQNGAAIQEGMDMLNKALQLRPEYDDAMAYLNLLYRQKADTECENPEEQQADLKTADDWQDKTLKTRQRREQKQANQTGGISPT
jgi:tetratricopeptide (TPR) repeat protein